MSQVFISHFVSCCISKTYVQNHLIILNAILLRSFEEKRLTTHKQTYHRNIWSSLIIVGAAGWKNFIK